MLLIDVVHAWPSGPEMLGQDLPGTVFDETAIEGLDTKWKVDTDELMEKLGKLSVFQTACLELWAMVSGVSGSPRAPWMLRDGTG